MGSAIFVCSKKRKNWIEGFVKRRLFKVLFVFENIEKSRTEPYLTNMVAGASVQFYFWPKVHEQATNCDQVDYRHAKAI